MTTQGWLSTPCIILSILGSGLQDGSAFTKLWSNTNFNKLDILVYTLYLQLNYRSIKYIWKYRLGISFGAMSGQSIAGLKQNDLRSYLWSLYFHWILWSQQKLSVISWGQHGETSFWIIFSGMSHLTLTDAPNLFGGFSRIWHPGWHKIPTYHSLDNEWGEQPSFPEFLC